MRDEEIGLKALIAYSGCLCEPEWETSDWLDGEEYEAETFLAALKNGIDKIPEKHRGVARIILTEYGSLYIAFRRPKTATEEEQERLTREINERKRESMELAEFERLKKKFG